MECKKGITEKELFAVLKKRMPYDSSPGNDGLTKEYFKMFWPEVKNTFLSYSLHSLSKGELYTSQRQAIIKLIVKTRNIQLIQNWKPISLLNIHVKIILNTLPLLISYNQSAYVDGRCMSENGR